VNKEREKEQRLTSWRITITSLLMLAPPMAWRAVPEGLHTKPDQQKKVEGHLLYR